MHSGNPKIMVEIYNKFSDNITANDRQPTQICKESEEIIHRNVNTCAMNDKIYSQIP